jgi:hypothetical protein
VINHARRLRLRQSTPTALRIGDLIMRVEGRGGRRSLVRWFRNTLRAAGLSSGELLSDSPEAAAAAEDAPTGIWRRSSCC